MQQPAAGQGAGDNTVAEPSVADPLSMPGPDTAADTLSTSREGADAVPGGRQGSVGDAEIAAAIAYALAAPDADPALSAATRAEQAPSSSAQPTGAGSEDQAQVADADAEFEADEEMAAILALPDPPSGLPEQAPQPQHSSSDLVRLGLLGLCKLWVSMACLKLDMLDQHGSCWALHVLA